MKRKKIHVGCTVQVDGAEGVVVRHSGDLCSVIHFSTLEETHHLTTDVRLSVWRATISPGDAVLVYVDSWYPAHVRSRAGDEVWVQPWGTRRKYLLHVESFRLLQCSDDLPQPFSCFDEDLVYAKVVVSNPTQSGYIVDMHAEGYVFKSLSGRSRLIFPGDILSATTRTPPKSRYLGSVLRHFPLAPVLWACRGCDSEFMVRILGCFHIFRAHNPCLQTFLPRTSYLLRKQLEELLPGAAHMGGDTERELTDAHRRFQLYYRAHTLERHEREVAMLRFDVREVRGTTVVVSVHRQGGQDYHNSPQKQRFFFPLYMEILGREFPARPRPWEPEDVSMPDLMPWQSAALVRVRAMEARPLSISEDLNGDVNPFTGFHASPRKTFGGVLSMGPWGKTRIFAKLFEGKRTLVLCRPSAFDGWMEAMRFCCVGWGTYYDGQEDVKQHVIVSTYRKWKNSPLRTFAFERIVMDDANTIALKSTLYTALLRERAPIRWCVVREPTQKELYLNLLQIAPFLDYVPTYVSPRAETHLERTCENRVYLHVKDKFVFRAFKEPLVAKKHIRSRILDQKMWDYITRRGETLLYHPKELPLASWALPERYTTLAQATATVEHTGSLEAMDQCPVCLEPPEKPAVLNCGHVFCTKCIRQWTRTCPVCRQPFSSFRVLRDAEDIVEVQTGSTSLSFAGWVHRRLERPVTDRLERVRATVARINGPVVVQTTSARLAAEVGTVVNTSMPSKHRRKMLRLFNAGRVDTLCIVGKVPLHGVTLKTNHVVQCGDVPPILDRVKRMGQRHTVYLYTVL